MIYWTTYNFAGYLFYKTNLIPMNAALKTSFICTSIIGGYMVYIYPRKLIVRYGENKKYNVPYPIMILGDLITHQLPLIDCIYRTNQIGLCGGYLFPLMMSWYGINKINIKDTSKIYGIKLEKLVYATCSIFATLGLFNHLPKLIKKN
jgi:hypothetical protein